MRFSCPENFKIDGSWGKPVILLKRLTALPDPAPAKFRENAPREAVKITKRKWEGKRKELGREGRGGTCSNGSRGIDAPHGRHLCPGVGL